MLEKKISQLHEWTWHFLQKRKDARLLNELRLAAGISGSINIALLPNEGWKLEKLMSAPGISFSSTPDGILCSLSGKSILLTDWNDIFIAVDSFVDFDYAASIPGNEDIAVFDIGANIGWHSTVMTMGISNAGQRYAFEPASDNFAILQKNMEIMRTVTGHNISEHRCAVGEMSGLGKLYLAPENMGDHKIFPDAQERGVVEIALKSLDDIFYDLPTWPTLVKLDTQGGEAAVIRGAARLFGSGWRPTLIFEFWPFGLRNAGEDAYDLWSFFSKLDYVMFEILPHAGCLRKTTDDYVQRRLDAPEMRDGEHFMDIVAIPSGSERIATIEHLIEA